MNNPDDYHSVLLCVRPSVTQVCVNGLPVGEMRNGAFVPDPLFDVRTRGVDFTHAINALQEASHIAHAR